MRLPLCCIITATLVAASCTAAEAQPRSRVDLEFGGWWFSWQPGIVMGVAGWVNDHSGVAGRAVFTFDPPGRDLVNYRGFETQYRHRRFLEAVEIDFGVGLMFLTATENVQQLWSSQTFETMDILVGYRFLERFGVKAGLGCHSWILSALTGGPGDDLPADLTFKFMVTVPLGAQR